jgi:hypothetical protein
MYLLYVLCVEYYCIQLKKVMRAFLTLLGYFLKFCNTTESARKSADKLEKNARLTCNFFKI